MVLDFHCKGDGPGVVEAPPEWIDRLAGVLIDNACKYAGPGGSVLVTVTVTGNRVTLCVDDSGPGIAPEERAAVFDRFHRATSEARGSGLGLAIADSVVRMSGGAWTVQTAPFGGAQMAVSWRRVTDRAGAATGRTDVGSGPAGPVAGGPGPTRQRSSRETTTPGAPS